MAYRIELFVKLKTNDTVALTARNTLEKDMGYEKIVRDLQREEYWLIHAACGDQREARWLAKELAEKTKIFVNPNKHTYHARVDGEGEVSEDPPGRGLQKVKVLTQYREDQKARLTLDTLQRTLGYGDKILGVERGTLWTLVLRAEGLQEARRVAEEVALTRGIDSGLLANPHSQTYAIL